ncbi:hypothetical protein BH10PSE6_BH10PSE6_37270 [soil metagenome]
MARPPDPKPDDPAQYQRFRDLAAELEANGSDKDVAEGVKRLARHKPQKRKPEKPASK